MTRAGGLSSAVLRRGLGWGQCSWAAPAQASGLAEPSSGLFPLKAPCTVFVLCSTSFVFERTHFSCSFLVVRESLSVLRSVYKHLAFWHLQYLKREGFLCWAVPVSPQDTSVGASRLALNFFKLKTLQEYLKNYSQKSQV